MPLSPLELPKERRDEMNTRLGMKGVFSAPTKINTDAVVPVYDLSEKAAVEVEIPQPLEVISNSHIKREILIAEYVPNTVDEDEQYILDVPIFDLFTNAVQFQPLFVPVNGTPEGTDPQDLLLANFLLKNFHAKIRLNLPQLSIISTLWRARIYAAEYSETQISDVDLWTCVGLAQASNQLEEGTFHTFIHIQPGFLRHTLEDDVYRHVPWIAAGWPPDGISNGYLIEQISPLQIRPRALRFRIDFPKPGEYFLVNKDISADWSFNSDWNISLSLDAEMDIRHAMVARPYPD